MKPLPVRDLTGLILAGGLSRRMGRNKAFLSIGGVPMIRREIDALLGVCRRVVIVAKDPDTFRSLGVPVVADHDSHRAALVGLCAGLRAVTTPYAFAASCDLPFLSAGAVAWLASQAPGFDAVVPRIGGRWHPLHAVYAAQAAAVFDDQRAAGRWRLAEAIERMRVRAVAGADLDAIDPGMRTLRNVNTPAEYRAARAQIAPRRVTRKPIP
jgi:molybdopterin-guanine dinucleotide biosynthesis protein A